MAPVSWSCSSLLHRCCQHCLLSIRTVVSQTQNACNSVVGFIVFLGEFVCVSVLSFLLFFSLSLVGFIDLMMCPFFCLTKLTKKNFKFHKLRSCFFFSFCFDAAGLVLAIDFICTAFPLVGTAFQNGNLPDCVLFTYKSNIYGPKWFLARWSGHGGGSVDDGCYFCLLDYFFTFSSSFFLCVVVRWFKCR